MKQKVSFILALVMVFSLFTSVPVTVSAASVDVLNFYINNDGESYAVLSCSTTAKGRLIIPDTYEGMPVTKISDHAFVNCTELTSITIPGSVTKIGECAFWNCSGLKSITISDSVKSIGRLSFTQCKNLTSITIPKGVTNIGELTFLNCTNLEAINVSKYNKYYSSVGGVLFNKDKTTLLTYPEGKINTGYKIPDGVISIGAEAFEYGRNLKSITISDSVKNIGESAFIYCSNLKSVTFGNSVTKIGELAFSCCTSLESITIPASVKTIGLAAFMNCLSLTKISVNKENKYYSAESGVLFNKSKTSVLQCPSGKVSSTYRIPGTVKSVGPYSFVACRNLTSIKIPNSVTSVGEYAFVHCPKLKSIAIPYTVTSIGEQAFGFYVMNSGGLAKYDGFTIHGKKGTTAEAYANENEFDFVAIAKPKQPTLKKIENTTSGVKVTWGNVSGASSYEIYRKSGDGSYKKIGTTIKTGYTDKKAASGKKYYYTVKAVNEAGKSSLSSSLSKYYLADPVLNTPSSTSKGVGLRWSKVAGAQGYMVYRKTGSSGTYTKITTEKGVSNLTYRDTTAKKDKKYYYKVKAYYSKTYSAFSNTKSVTDKY